jgi:predicted ThiF/HesA family dinucleotide-utilizing enzyme
VCGAVRCEDGDEVEDGDTSGEMIVVVHDGDGVVSIVVSGCSLTCSVTCAVVSSTRDKDSTTASTAGVSGRE